MARRSRQHRHEIPGYDESRPTREERKQQHRATRHAAHQQLHMMDDMEDLDDVVLPEERRSRTHDVSHEHVEPTKRRFKVWKTKFWKRRDDFKTQKAAMDSEWPVVAPEEQSPPPGT